MPTIIDNKRSDKSKGSLVRYAIMYNAVMLITLPMMVWGLLNFQIMFIVFMDVC